MAKKSRSKTNSNETNARTEAKTTNVEDINELDDALTREEVEEEEETAELAMKLQNDEVDVEVNDDALLSDDASEASETLEATPSSSKANAIFDSSSNSSKRPSTKPNRSQNIAGTNAKRSRKRRGSGVSSEEERWLSAIEKGKLNDVDEELKKIKDPKLMTARQRAMYERGHDKDPDFPISEMLMSLPTGYKEKEKPQSAEDIQKAQLKLQRRRQQADEKREKDKKKTMDRLLKKQETKQRATGRNRITKVIEPIIRYKNSIEGVSLIIPPDYDFPLKAQTYKKPPPVQLCGIAGCGNPKVYNCSKTNIPLCSLSCYKKNVQKIKEIMC